MALRKKGKLLKSGIMDYGTFGDWQRYHLTSMVTRFNTVCWFVSDAEKIDTKTGLPDIIRQCDTKEQALSGLM